MRGVYFYRIFEPYALLKISMALLVVKKQNKSILKYVKVDFVLSLCFILYPLSFDLSNIIELNPQYFKFYFKIFYLCYYLCRKGSVNLDIGKKIRTLRLQKNIPQNDLAQILGVSKSTMSNYERNYSTPDPELLVRIADYFNVSIDYLFDYELHISDLTRESSDYNRMNGSGLSKDEWNVLSYYSRLSDENKDLIKGQMIQLYLDQSKAQKGSEPGGASV